MIVVTVQLKPSQSSLAQSSLAPSDSAETSRGHLVYAWIDKTRTQAIMTKDCEYIRIRYERNIIDQLCPEIIAAAV